VHTSRTGHYFTWFIVFGVIAGLVSLLGHQTVSSEALWLLISGVLGMLFSNQRVKDVGRYYDFIIGVIFTLAGLAGLVYNINASLLPSALASNQMVTGRAQDATLIGLSLAVVPSILHLILGVISFQHGLNNTAKGK
jgi:hypothetical protein